MAELLNFLLKQSEAMKPMMETMAHDRSSQTTMKEKDHLANAKLDEKYFRNVARYSSMKSDWKEWRRQFLNAVRECDVGFADMVEGFELLEVPIDHLHDYNPTHCQLSTNLYNRLISYTTGMAFQSVESVPHHNGGEAWRLLSK